MSWFIFELRREGRTMTEMDEFPLLEAALKHASDNLVAMTGADRQMSIGVGQVTAGNVDWIGELRLDPHGRPAWTSERVPEPALAG
jgi:hypothetical protein